MTTKDTERSKAMAKPAKAVAVVKEKEIAAMQGNSPADMIRMAVSGKADLDKLEKLLALQKDWEANEARKLYASSFATVQANIALVVKTKSNPQTHSKYAALEGIIASSKPIYTAEGFAIIFSEGKPEIENAIRICADVLHRSGHKESYYYDVPLDGVGIKGNANMTRIHGKASSTSYGRRYLMCMIWNIPTGDDDDGVTAGKPEVTMPKAVETPQNATKQPAPATLTPQAKDIPETDAMNDRAVAIAEDFRTADNLITLEEKRAKYKVEVNTKMSKGYKNWLIGEYYSVHQLIESETKENLNGK